MSSAQSPIRRTGRHLLAERQPGRGAVAPVRARHGQRPPRGAIPRIRGGGALVRPPASFVVSRAPARQIYRAFCTKKDAEEDIENVVAPGEGALEELAFIAVVGDFAGVASWDEESDPVVGTREFLRWQPPSVRLGPFANLEAYEPGQQAIVAELMGDRLDRVRQELHVIDLRSFLCVTLVSPTVPEAVAITDVNWPNTPSYLQNGDAVFSPTLAAIP